MRRFLVGLLALLLLMPALRASDDSKDKPKPASDPRPGADKDDPKTKVEIKKKTPEEEFNSIVEDYAKKQQDFFKEYRAAKTDADRQKLMVKYPQARDFSGKIMAVVEKHPKDAFVVTALTFVAMNDRGSAHAERAVDLLVSDHIQSAKLGQICQALVYSSSPKAEKALRTILEKSPNKDVQGQACYSLAVYLKNQGEHARGGKTKEPAQKTPEAESLFERVESKFADVKLYGTTLGALAKGELFEIRHLSIGKVAPEIAGEDLDGKKFKLTDYRGKVVVLDFWGNW